MCRAQPEVIGGDYSYNSASAYIFGTGGWGVHRCICIHQDLDDETLCTDEQGICDPGRYMNLRCLRIRVFSTNSESSRQDDTSMGIP